ncbi:MAG TPA: hypothetical protein PKY87_02670 [Terricaulis sp.]|nr:hypothetical protein [Terricaulis sp.]
MMRGLILSYAFAALTLSACGQQAEHSPAHQMAEDAADFSTDKPAYLTQLMLIRGHLQAGAALYAAGEAAMAATHMKHPEDELYAQLKPALPAWGATDFAGALQALAASVEGRAAPSQVEADLANVRAAIDAAADASNPSARELLLASAATLRTAADEFDIALTDSAVTDIHEYQDAYGFMITTLEYLTRFESTDPAVQSALATARAQAALALAVLPPAQTATRAETIHAAAAQIEAAAQGLE